MQLKGMDEVHPGGGAAGRRANAHIGSIQLVEGQVDPSTH